MTLELETYPKGRHEDLTIPQFGIWLAQKLLAGQPTYNVGEYLDIEGALDPDRFEEALSQVVGYTDAFRVRVVEDENGPKQYLIPERSEGRVSRFLDVSALSDPVGEAERWMAEDLAQVVDLGKDPSFCFMLFKITSNRWFWYSRYHHIVADGVTGYLVARRVAEAYSGSTRKVRRASIFDLLAQERVYQASEDFAEDRRYWRAELEDMPAAVTISSRAPVKSSAFMRQSGGLSRTDFDAMRHRYPNVKAQELVLAATALYLHRLSGATDLVIGVAFSRRHGMKQFRIAGMVSGVLPVRLKISEDMSLEELLALSHEKLRQASAHQRYSEAGIRSDLGLSPDEAMYGVVVNIMSFDYDLSFDDCRVTHVKNVGNWMVEDFQLAVYDHFASEDILVETFAKPESYNPTEHAQHHHRFMRFLLELTLMDPAMPIRRIEVTSKRDHKLLGRFHDVEIPSESVDFVQRFMTQVVEHREAPAVIAGDRVLSYGDLDRLARVLASRLVHEGATVDGLVGIAVPRSIEMVIGLCGILLAGSAYVPIDPQLPPKRRDLLLKEAGIDLLLVDEETEPLFTHSACCCVRVDRVIQDAPSDDAPPSLPDVVRWAGGDGDGLAYVKFTSGSTGLPKGVLVTRAAVIRLVVSPNFVDLDPQTRMLHLAPISFDAATFEIWGPLLNGGALVVMPPGPLSLEHLARTLEIARINTLWLTAGLFHRVVDEILSSLGFLRCLLAGGDVLSVDHVQRVLEHHPGLRLINGYGPTENTTFSTCADLAREDDFTRGAPIGKPINETCAFVLDHRLKPTPVGLTGDLYLSGTGLARGYLNQPGFTASRFIPNPLAHGGDRLYVTGDRAQWREDGTLLFFGRADRQIKLRGFRIEPGEIEAVLASYVEVEAALVFLDPQNKGRLVGAVQSPGALKPEDLEHLLREQLPDYMVPRIWAVVERFPINTNGKVDTNTLAAEARAQSSAHSDAPFERPTTPVERSISIIFGELLGRDESNPLGIYENLFEAGCDSMIAMQAIYRARRANISIRLEQVFRTPNIASLARLHQTEHADPEALRRFQLRERPERIQLSSSQRRLWFMHRLTPNHAYNIPLGFQLRGHLNVDALEQAFRQLVRRHEVLRTRFYEWNGSPYQEILPELDIQLSLDDVTSRPQPMAWIGREFDRRAGRAFDLEAAPPWEVSLFRVTPEEHVLLLIKHHIISDGWSLEAMFDDLKQLYRANLVGATPRLPPLLMQYADYSLWEQSQHEEKTQEQERQLEWWVEQLQEPPEPLALPGQVSRTASPSFRGGRRSFVLDEQVTAQLKALGRQCGTTLYMTLLAIYTDFLGRYSGTRDLVIGTPTHGRTNSELKHLIGCFINLLALRMDFRQSGQRSIREHLGLVRQRVLAAWARQDLPFELLVDRLNPVRRFSHMPLFQVMFVLQPSDPDLKLDGLEMTRITPTIDSAKSDLTLDMRETDGALEGVFEYSLDCFDAETVADLLVHFTNLVSRYADASDNADQDLSRLQMLDEAEFDKLLHHWNPERRPLPDETCVNRRFATQAQHTPRATALEWPGGRIDYGELHHRAQVLAAEIEREGVTAEDRVAICLPRGPNLIIAMLGILEAGAVYVPIDPKWPLLRRSWIAEDAEISLAILQSEAEEKEFAPGVPRLGLDQVDFEQPTPSRLTGPAMDLQAAYINYTSGSTGKPKGVLATHRSIIRLLFDTNYVSLDRHSSVLQMSNASFDGATFEIWAPLLQGGRCVLYPDEIPEPRLIGRLINDHGVNTLFITTALFNRVVSDDPLHFSGIRQLYTGGEVMSAEHMAQAMEALPETRFANIYGPTENTVFSSWFPLDETPSPDENVPIGFPITHTQAYVLDASGNLVPPGLIGELFLGGEGLARGYFKRPGRTAEVFVPDPFSEEPGARLYRSGDLVSHTPFGPQQGSLRFHGRADHQVKIRGFRIELGEIENRLTAHKSVTEAAVVVHGKGIRKMLVGYAVIDPEAAPLSASDLRSHVHEALPDYMVPQAIQLLPHLPLTTTGKLDRKALPTPEHFEQIDTYMPPRNPLEQQLADIWREVLTKDRMEQLQPVGIRNNFFELGGHSLSATQVISRIRDNFGVQLAVRELFEAPTIAELADKLGSEGVPNRPDAEDRAFTGKAQAAREESARRITSRPAAQPVVSFSQERLWVLDRLDPGAHTYNMPFAYRIDGSVEAEVLESALTALVDRHDALRTLFPTVDGQVQPTILPTAPWTLQRYDVRRSSDPEAELDALRLREAKQGFDLATGPLFRTVLVDLAEDEQALIFTIHHIVFDGWSMRCFLEELQAFYAAFESRETASVAPLPIQFQDFAAQQREWFDEGILDEQLEYWRERLAEVDGGELPTDHPRPPIQTHSGAWHHLTIDQELTQALKSLAEARGVSLFIVLLAGFKVLVHRRTQAEDVVIGAPIAGRNFAEVEPLIGFFLNTLVLRTDFADPDELRFEEVLERVAETALGAYQNQDVPFEKLLQEFNPPRDLSRTPYFQIMFNMFNPTWGSPRLGEAGMTPLVDLEAVSKFDITLYVGEKDRCLDIDLVYNTDLFTSDTIRVLLDQYHHLLRDLVARPDTKILGYRLDEDNALLPDPSAPTRADVPPLVPAILARSAYLRPDALAVADTQIRLTYGELNTNANRLANYLIGQGLEKGDVVAIYAHRNAALITSILGILKAGCVFLILDPAHPTLRLGAYLRLAKPKALVHISEAGPLSQPLLEVIDHQGCSNRLTYTNLIAGSSDDPLMAWPDSEPDVSYRPDDPASIVFTSGSTGIPKGVLGKLSGLSQARDWYAETFDLTAADRHAMFSGLAHDLIQRDLFSPILFGAAVLIPETQDIRAPERLIRWMNQHKITVANLTPPMLDLLNQAFTAKGYTAPLAELRRVFTVGALLTKESVQTFLQHAPRAEVVNLYGSTETQRSVSYFPIPRELPACPSSIPLGRGIDGVQLLVLNETGQPAAVGELGEICFRSRQMALGYLDDDERTETQFLVNPWGDSQEDRLYRTGDLGRYTEDGQVLFAGRVDRQVKLRGHRLELPEVEACLSTFTQVAQNVAVVENDVLISYLVPKQASGTRLSATELRAFMAGRLPNFMIPSRFMVLDHIPLTANGKVDHQALPVLAEHLEGAPGTRPLNQTEKAVSDIFKEVLGLPNVNRDDNFFEIGGSSVQAVQTCYKIQERFNTDLPAIKIFEHPSVEALTRLLSANEDAEPRTAGSGRIEARRQQARQRRRSRATK